VVALVVPALAATTLGGPAAGGTTAVAEMIGAAAAAKASLGTRPATVGALTLVVSVGVGSAFAERTGAGGGGGGGLAAATAAAGSDDTVGTFADVTVCVVEPVDASEVWSTLKNMEEVALANHVLGSRAVVAVSVVGATVVGAGLELVDPGRLVGTVPMLSVTTAPYTGPVALVCPVFCFGDRTRSVTTGTYVRCWGIQKRRYAIARTIGCRAAGTTTPRVAGGSTGSAGARSAGKRRAGTVRAERGCTSAGWRSAATNGAT
jgi:hypothetical protein